MMRRYSISVLVLLAAVSVTSGLETGEARSSSGRPRPMAGWTFDDVDGTQVAGIGDAGKPARLVTATDGRPPALVNGIRGNALQFLPGDRHAVQVGAYRPLPPPGDAFTVTAWVKLQGGKRHVILDAMARNDGQKQPYGVRIYSDWHGTLTVHVAQGGSEHKVKTEKWAIPRDYWAHIAVTCDGQALKLYVNATLVEETRLEPKISFDAPWPICFIGSHHYMFAWPFHGMIDEPMLYDKTLSEAQIVREICEPREETGDH